MLLFYILATDLESEFGREDQNEEPVDDRVYIGDFNLASSVLNGFRLGQVRPRPQDYGIHDRDEHHESDEPFGADDSVADDSVYSRSPVLRCMMTMMMMMMMLVLVLLVMLLRVAAFHILFG